MGKDNQEAKAWTPEKDGGNWSNLECQLQTAYAASQIGSFTNSPGVTVKQTGKGMEFNCLALEDAKKLRLLTQVGSELGEHRVERLWLTLLKAGQVVAPSVAIQATHWFTQRAQIARALGLATDAKFYTPFGDDSQKVGLKDAIDQLIQLDSYIGQIEYDTVILNIQFGFSGWNV
jgi:hypothetical protein